MEKEIKQCLTDIRDFCGAVKEYFALKNKVLWTGSSSWISGSITVPGISKYQTTQVGVGLANHSGMLYKRNGAFGGGVVIGYPAWQATQSFVLTLSGDTLTMTDNVMLAHNQSSNHAATKYKVYGITEIVGIDPIIPDAPKKYIGGGYYIRKIGGAWHEAVNHLKGYIKCIKDTCRNNSIKAKQSMDFNRQYKSYSVIHGVKIYGAGCHNIVRWCKHTYDSTRSMAFIKCKISVCRILQRYNLYSNNSYKRKGRHSAKRIYSDNNSIRQITPRGGVCYG